jgi:Tol biopolymer transport system component
MRRWLRSELVATAAALALAGALAAPAARAEFGPIQLVSKSSKEQAKEAVTPAISADGHFVAFAGQIDGQEGIFREDLQTGAILPVVDLGKGEWQQARPSISGDGRYVAFTTALPLDSSDDTNSAPDVYRADLSTVPPTYELVSALDDCAPTASPTSCGLAYVNETGSVAAGRVAISESGQRVAFLVRSESDLAGAGTAAGQVAVRDLESHRTYLMTVRKGTDEAAPEGGADVRSEGAAISGDGSTVAWAGSHLPEQVPMLVDEEAMIRALESRPSPEPEAREYHEPLWRRVPTPLEEDPATRRVVGGGDPLAAGCPADGTLATPACQGPYPELAKGRSLGETFTATEGAGWGLSVPRLDRDGGVVALVGNPGEDGDLFVVDMAAGLSRVQAVRQLTRWVNPVPGENNPSNVFDPKYASLTGRIEECAISPDGNRIAFTTVRQIFPLAPPTLVSPVPVGPAEVRELYQVDLAGETIERTTPGGGGNISLGGFGATTPSYSDEGRFLAFASDSYNLVAGDTNTKSDAFVVESPPPAPVEPTRISPKPASLVVQPLWRMTVTASSLPDGRVRLVVGVPGAGAVRAKASARLGPHLRRHQVAATHRRAGAAGTQTLLLNLSHNQRKLAKRKGGLYAQLDIVFEASGGKPLKSGIDARFLVHHPKGKKK